MRFAELLGVADPRGLIERLFGGMSPDEAMIGAVRAARQAGVRTGLVSNSWGAGGYDRTLFESCSTGSSSPPRRASASPIPGILRSVRSGSAWTPLIACSWTTAARQPQNPRALAATVHHVSAEQTIPELERLLRVALA